METSITQQRLAFDEIAAELRTMRAAAGDPSYAELVRRVVELRVARGLTPWEARVGRTTVYDAFRPGRWMIDPALVADLVVTLGASPAQAEQWRRRCAQARRPSAVLPPPRLVPSPSPSSDAVGASTPAPDAADGTDGAVAPRPWAVRALLAGCLLLNLGGRVFVLGTHVPLYLDMVGTAIAAIAVGPWAGVLVGVCTSVAGAGIDGWISVPFAPVEVIGALVWGYGVRRVAFVRSVPGFFLLNLVVAVCCTVIAVPIIVWLDHGMTGDGADAMTRSMEHIWHSLLAAVLSQNLITSIADKLISGFCALAVCESLPMARGRSRRALFGGVRMMLDPGA